MKLEHRVHSFRSDTTNRLFKIVRAGESANVVGFRGVGKSSFIDHLCEPQVREEYLGDAWQNYLFVRVNFRNLLEYDYRSIFSLLIDQIEDLANDIGANAILGSGLFDFIEQMHAALLAAGEDILVAQRHFKLAIRHLLADDQLYLVFLFDQFDRVYDRAESPFFVSLRGIRDSYKYRLTFIVFAHNELPTLASPEAPSLDRFIELVIRNSIRLMPHNHDDALHILRSVARRNQIPLNESLITKLCLITGKHAGLIRASLSDMANSITLDLDDAELVASLAKTTDVMTECGKIWDSLSADEQHSINLLTKRAAPDNSEVDDKKLHQLTIKGLLNQDGNIFSPIFEEYVKKQEEIRNRPLYLDRKNGKIWSHGKLVETLTPLEYGLFELLYDHSGEVITKDILIDTGWPNAKGGVTDAALAQHISRIRQKLVQINDENAHLIENIRNQGYCLNVESWN